MNVFFYLIFFFFNILLNFRKHFGSVRHILHIVFFYLFQKKDLGI